MPTCRQRIWDDYIFSLSAYDLLQRCSLNPSGKTPEEKPQKTPRKFPVNNGDDIIGFQVDEDVITVKVIVTKHKIFRS